MEDTASDEALARALQEELNLEAAAEAEARAAAGGGGGGGGAAPSPPPAAPPPPPPPPGVPAEVPLPGDDDVCAGCARPLIPRLPALTGPGGLSALLKSLSAPREERSASFLSALGKLWHPGCLKCAGCREPLAANASGALSFALDDDGSPFHAECHRRLRHPRCAVCGEPLPAADGRIVWMQVPFWGDRMCPSHADEPTVAACTACTRRRPAREEWAPLPDGRVECLSCLDTAVIDTRAAAPLYDAVLGFFASLGMPLPARPPLALVDFAALNAAGGHGAASGPVFHTRGLCVTEYTTSVWRLVADAGAGRGGGGAGRPPPAWPPGGAPPAATRCSVAAVLVLSHLPRLLTGSVLAHELMHAWLRLSGCHGLAPRVEEGLCQLMALLWLEGAAGAGALPGFGGAAAGGGAPSQPFEARLASFFAYSIREEPSEVYGGGFRDAHDAFQRVGLRATLDAVKATGRLP